MLKLNFSNQDNKIVLKMILEMVFRTALDDG